MPQALGETATGSLRELVETVVQVSDQSSHGGVRSILRSSHQLTTTDVPPGTLNIWSYWDGEHYVALALNGYFQAPRYISPAFFPMYPLLLRSFSAVFGGPLSKEAFSYWGSLLSLLFLPFAFYFIYQIAYEGWDERTAKGTLLALAFFPTTFFLNATYTESLFLALSAGSLWAIRVRKNLLLACILAGLATATRNVAIFLIVPVMFEWIKQGGMKNPRERWRGLYLALAPSGLIVYMGYLWIKFGDPLLFYSSQKYWKREAAGPLVTATRAWDTAVEAAIFFPILGSGLIRTCRAWRIIWSVPTPSTTWHF